jgi:hypothetical protein
MVSDVSAQTASGICIRTVPVGDVLVCDARGHVEHDDTALAVDVVAITETTELLLTRGIPDIELDRTEVLSNLLVECCRRGARERYLTVVNPRGWTSTPRVAMYFFSNSPVKWRLTKVVYSAQVSILGSVGGVDSQLMGGGEGDGLRP